MKITIRMLYYITLAFLFLHMLFLPKLFMETKAVFVGIAILLSLCVCRGCVSFTKGKFLILIYIILNIISIIIGLMKGYGIYAIRPITLLVIWPSCFFIMNVHFEAKQMIWIYKTILIVTFILCVLDLLFLFSRNEWLAKIVLFMNRNIPRAGKSGYWVLRVDHLYFFAFLTPFTMAVFLNRDKVFCLQNKISKGFIDITFALALFVSVLAGMGAIWLACVVGAIICVFEFQLLRKKKALFLILVFAFCAMVFMIKSYFGEGMIYHILREISDKFGKNSAISEHGDSVRINQAKAMIDAWIKSPIWGQGVGSPIYYYRSGEYAAQSENELQYLIVLYQRGILGASSFLLIVSHAIKILNSRRDIRWLTEPFKVGFISFMVANAFNPYMANLSFLWILFFPFLLEKRKES